MRRKKERMRKLEKIWKAGTMKGRQRNEARQEEL